MNQQTVALDFDGVVHAYTTPWTSHNIIPDDPVPGAKEAIEFLRKDYRVVIYTTRASTVEGKAAIYEWLYEHGISVDDVTAKKPRAIIYVDDRGFRFQGDWVDVITAVHKPTPWNKGGDDN